jgi:5-methylcytosine-specific restriction endonuclease McrA
LYRYNRTDGGNQNIAYERKRKKTINDRLLAKIQTFHRQGGAGTMCDKKSFTVQDVISKYGDTTKCYLTGIDINIYETKTYEFDHIIPRSRGGQNTLDNLGIASKKANQSKNSMTVDEYINLCKMILENNGYEVILNKE